jgi:hypothetical protein
VCHSSHASIYFSFRGSAGSELFWAEGASDEAESPAAAAEAVVSCVEADPVAAAADAAGVSAAEADEPGTGADVLSEASAAFIVDAMSDFSGAFPVSFSSAEEPDWAVRELSASEEGLQPAVSRSRDSNTPARRITVFLFTDVFPADVFRCSFPEKQVLFPVVFLFIKDLLLFSIFFFYILIDQFEKPDVRQQILHLYTLMFLISASYR